MALKDLVPGNGVNFLSAVNLLSGVQKNGVISMSWLLMVGLQKMRQ